MLPILLGITAVALLAGCSRKREDPPPPPPEEKEIPYAKSCFIDQTCPSQQKTAALFDYAGTVYGEKARGKYDGLLTLGEKKEAENVYGPLLDAPWANTVLFKAQMNFFGPSQMPDYCNELSIFHFLRASDPQWGEGVALGGAHHCGLLWGLLYTSNNLEFQVASDPEKWVFFIESSEEVDLFRKYESFPQKSEFDFFHQIADRLGIPAYNPLHPLDSRPVIEAMGRKGLSAKEYGTILLIAGAPILQESPGLSGQPPPYAPGIFSSEKEARAVLSNLNEFLRNPKNDPKIKFYLKNFQITPAELVKEYSRLLEVPPREMTASHLNKLAETISKVFKIALEISNSLSVDRVQKILKESGKKHAFYQIGARHLPLIQKVYSQFTPVDLDPLLRKAGPKP